MKISRRLMLRLSGLGATTMALMGCAGQGEGFLAWLEGLFPSASVPGTPAQPGAPEAPAPVQPALPPYNADPLTGEARRTDGRIVGVMVNNICNSRRQNARPQRGIGAADLLIESRVEGGITRLCAVYHDVDAIPEVGPVRSGRDQFLQLLMPWAGPVLPRWRERSLHQVCQRIRLCGPEPGRQGLFWHAGPPADRPSGPPWRRGGL